MAEGGHNTDRKDGRQLSEMMCGCNMVSMKIITKNLLKAGITNTLYRSEVDVLWVEDENVDPEEDSELLPGSISKNDKS
jgi:hypothetical protein